MTAPLKLLPRNTTDKLLSVIDALRQDVVEGRVVAIAVAAVCPDDCCSAYAGAAKGVSRLRMQGAIAQLQHAYLSGELLEADG